MPTVVFRGNRDQLNRLLQSVPSLLAGTVPDPLGLARGFQLRLSTALLSQVQQDFLTLARGGRSRDGREWPPLAPSTIARRTRTKAEVEEFKRRKRRDPKLTALAFFGSREVEILRDTTRLYRSLTPGVEEVPAQNPDQVLRLGRGELIVGSNVPYGADHQNGRPPHLPARPFLPVGKMVPEVYWPAILAAGARGLVRVVTLLVGAAR